MLKRLPAKLCSVVAVLVFIVSAVSAHSIGWPAKRLARLYPGADSYKEMRKSLAVGQAARIKKAVGKQFNKWDEAPSFYIPIGTKPNGGKGALALLYIIDAEGKNGTIEMGITVTLKGKVIRVILFENKEPRAISSKEFLSQFEGMTVGPNSYHSPEELKVKGQAPILSQEQKELAGFLKEQHKLMKEANALKKTLKKQVNGRQLEANTVSEFGEKWGEYLSLLKRESLPLSDNEIADFRTKAQKTATELKAFQESAKGENWGNITKRFDVMSSSCNKCHAIYYKRYAKKLGELAPVDNFRGHFIVGRDIRSPKGAEVSAQAVATAVKKGLLMMKELF